MGLKPVSGGEHERAGRIAWTGGGGFGATGTLYPGLRMREASLDYFSHLDVVASCHLMV